MYSTLPATASGQMLSIKFSKGSKRCGENINFISTDIMPTIMKFKP
jgi:hypothetical protein